MMTRRIIAGVIAAVALLGSVPTSAAQVRTPVASVATEQTRLLPEARDRRGGGVWIVSILALLAVVGGIIAAASSDSQPESP